jgi:hypothetical protein
MLPLSLLLSLLLSPGGWGLPVTDTTAHQMLLSGAEMKAARLI